jgi:hypothetical protein
MVVQLLKKFTAFEEARKFITVVHKKLPLNQMKAIPTLLLYLLE